MLTHISFACFMLIVTTSSYAQDAKDLLRESAKACQAATQGYYETTRQMKYMSGPDTSTRTQICHFRKLPEDTLFEAAFHYTQPIDSVHSFHVLYTGEEFVTCSEKDSTGRIMVRSMWADNIEQIKHNYDYYDPLIRKKASPLPDEEDLADSTVIIQYIAEEQIHNTTCHHIRINHVPDNEEGDPMKTLRVEYHFWINTSDLIPIRYSTAFDLVMNNDTMHQYEVIQLDHYDLGDLRGPDPLSLTSIPSYMHLKDYVPYTAPPLLPVDTIAPGWSLPLLQGTDIRLEDLRGKVVLIDFFYKACYPCMLALPGLQALHDRYADQGLVVIGINPFDTRDELTGFLEKRGVTYPIALDGKEVARDYHISGYPTIYILNKNGEIVFAESGYGEGKEKEYEEIILRHL